MADNVAAVAADDDFDVTADLAAAFDAAENDTPIEPVKEPEGETAEQAAERVRDEKGRFAAKPEEPEPVVAKVAPAPVKEAAPSDTAVPAIEAQPNEAAVARPPTSWSPTAKVLFDKIPPEVQQAIAKREEDVAKGFERYQRLKPIEKYDEMARQGGTTLDRALENYVGIEQELSRDMVAGIARICQNKGIHPVALANEILARNGVSPQQGEAGGTDPQQVRNGGPQQAPVDLTPITNELNALKSYVQQQQSAGVQSEIQRFTSNPEHKFFENVKADMGRLLNSGQAETMEDAYEQACWANKEIRALLIKQQSVVSDPSAKVAAATQARAASKSITGTPIPGAGSKGPESSLEDEIRQLMDASV